MGGEDRDELVVDVADALTLDQEVDWERCARQATPANRQALDNLRLIAEVFAGARASGDASASAGPETRPGVLVRLAVRALLVIAAVEVAAALLLLPWAWGAPGGGSRRRLVAVRATVRDGLGGAPVRRRRGRHREDRVPHPAPASRRRGPVGGGGLGRGGGRGRVRGVDADGAPVGTPGHRGRIRGRAPRRSPRLTPFLAEGAVEDQRRRDARGAALTRTRGCAWWAPAL